MASFTVTPSLLKGALTVPSSKSHTMRAIFFAAMAHGSSFIENYLPSPDTQAMISAVMLLGAKVKVSKNILEVDGVAGNLQPAKDVIQCGNSGQVLRFIGALAGTLLPQYTVLTGDSSLKTNRPIRPLLDGLCQLGAFAVSSTNNDHAPIIVKGPITFSRATIDGQDSQPISGLLMAAAFATQPLELFVKNPGEKPWIDLTLSWFEKLGIPYYASNYSHYKMEGNAKIKGFSYQVPGDFSSAAFPLAAAAITGSKLTLNNIYLADIQGDKEIISVLEKMGARFDFDEKNKSLTILENTKLTGIKVDVNNFIDALPILAVLGCFAEGQTEIFNAAIARKKESDRIHLIAKELKKMGADIEEKPAGLVINSCSLKGAEVYAHQDHRLALALTTAALAATAASKIVGIECIDKSYHCFYDDFVSVGAQIKK